MIDRIEVKILMLILERCSRASMGKKNFLQIKNERRVKMNKESVM